MRPVIAVIAARMGSSRMPGKCMSNVKTRPVLSHILERLNRSRYITHKVIATTTETEDGIIAEWASENNQKVYLGDSQNVVQRCREAVEAFYPKLGSKSPYVYRVLSDQPFFDWESFDAGVEIMESRNWDFVLPLSFEEDPVYGAGNSPWSWKAWNDMVENSSEDELEHPGMWIRRNLDLFDYGLRDLPHWMYRPYRLELDTEYDLQLVDGLWRRWAKPSQPELRWVVGAMDRNPSLSAINAHVDEKTGTYTSFSKQEILQWFKDYTFREVVYTSVPDLVGTIQSSDGLSYTCKICEGPLIALEIKKGGDLKLKCARCTHERIFYAVNPK